MELINALQEEGFNVRPWIGNRLSMSKSGDGYSVSAVVKVTEDGQAEISLQAHWLMGDIKGTFKAEDAELLMGILVAADSLATLAEKADPFQKHEKPLPYAGAL